MVIEEAWKRLRLAQKEFGGANDTYNQTRRDAALRELDAAEESLQQAYAKEGITHIVVGKHEFDDGTYEFTEPLFQGNEADCIEWERKNKGVPGPSREGIVKQSYSAVFPIGVLMTSSEAR